MNTLRLRLWACLLFLIPGISSAQEKYLEEEAVLLLDKMSKVIGELTACSYLITTASDGFHPDYGREKIFQRHQVHMRGPDKMYVKSSGNKDRKGYWYNGQTLTYYSYTENNYAVIGAPSSIIGTLDSINRTYGVDFPAADFFYPTFTDDVIDHFDSLVLRGLQWVEGQDAFHIVAISPTMHAQLWLANDAYRLPVKFVLTYRDRPGFPQYEGTFENWEINPNLPSAIFEFTPPPRAIEIAILPKEPN